MKTWLSGLLIACACVSAHAADAPKNWTVSPGQSIQDAIDQAAPGDTVQVLPGEYVQSVEIKKDNITLKGFEYEGERTTLKSKVNEEDEPLEGAIRIGGNGVTVEGFVVRGFGKFGVGADNCAELTLRDLIIEDTGTTGVRLNAVRTCTLDRVVAGRIGFAAIGIEDSTECRIVQSEAYSSRLGLYISNAQQVTIENSSFHHNGIGLALSGTVADPDKRLAYVKVLRTRIMGNVAMAAVASELPLATASSGIGVLLDGATEVEIAQSDISGNASMGVVTVAHDEKGVRHQDKYAVRSGPLAEHIYMHHNHYADNGAAPSPEFTKLFAGIAPGDIYWDGLGERNQWQENVELKTYPEKLVVKQGGVHTDVIHFQ
jgi:hypothetical protein